MVLNLDVFEDNEYDFLLEYQRVMKAIASALKTMEANKYTFGIYLPTLFGLRMKLASFVNTVVHCLPLVEVIQDAFEERFGNVMDIFAADGKSIPAYVAMVSNPNYKLNYMGMKTIPAHILLRVKQLLLDAGMDIMGDELDSDQQDDTVVDSGTAAFLILFAFDGNTLSHFVPFCFEKCQ